VAAGVATSARETLAEYAARQIRSKLLLDVPREPSVVVLAGVGEEGFEVLADETVQNGFCGATRQIGGSEDGHEAPYFAGRMP
jgi:hypothetical protein